MAALILTAWSWARRLVAALPFEAILMAAAIGWGGMQTYEATRAESRADDLRAELSTANAVNAGLANTHGQSPKRKMENKPQLTRFQKL